VEKSIADDPFRKWASGKLKAEVGQLRIYPLAEGSRKDEPYGPEKTSPVFIFSSHKKNLEAFGLLPCEYIVYRYIAALNVTLSLPSPSPLANRLERLENRPTPPTRPHTK